MGVIITGGGTNPPSSGTKKKKTTTSSSSSGSSSGGSTRNSQDPYVQRYRLLFGSNVAPNMNLVRQAVSGNWSGAYFDMQVRLKDPKYFRSQEAKQRTLQFSEYWKAVLPGAKMNKGLLRRYLRGSWNEDQLQQQMMKLPSFMRSYKFYNQYAAAQRKAGLAAGVNPLAYKQAQETFRNAYKQYGIDVPQGYEKLFFKSGITDDEFINNLSMINQTAPAAQWDVGGITEQQKQAGLFNGRGANQIRGLLQTALNKQQGYMKSRANPFQIQTQDDTVKLVGL
jgi:hypothetical protein